MKLSEIDRVSLSAHQPNEDAWGATAAAAWVIDGASAVDPYPYFDPESDSALLAQFATETLRSELDVVEAPLDLLATAVRSTAMKFRNEIADRLPRHPFTLPSAAFTIAGLADGELAIVGLGDVTLVHQHGSTSNVYENRAALEHELAQIKLPGSTAAQITRKGRNRRRTAMNRNGGYWILSDCPEAAEHLRTTQFAAAIDDLVLLMSDGFARCVQVYNLYENWQELLRALSDGRTLAEVGEQLRSIEADDEQCLRYPRISTRDDATAVLVRIVS